MSKCEKISGSVLAYRKSCVIGRQVDAQRGIGKRSGDCLRNQFVESSDNWGKRVLFDIICGSGYYAWTGQNRVRISRGMEALRMDRDHDSSLLSGSTRTYEWRHTIKKRGPICVPPL